MKTWIIPVAWSETSTIEVEANTLAEAIDISKNPFVTVPKNGIYVSDSIKVLYDDIEFVREVYNWNQQDEKPEELKKVIHAHWEPLRAYPSEYICSYCGELWKEEKTPYCHECGAKMDEVVK